MSALQPELFSKYHSSLKCLELLEKTDSKYGTEKVGEFGIAFTSRKQEIIQCMTKGHKTSLQELPTTKKNKKHNNKNISYVYSDTRLKRKRRDKKKDAS